MSRMTTVRSTMRSVRVSHTSGASSAYGVLGYIRGEEYCNGVKVYKPHSKDEIIAWGAAGLDGFNGKAENLIAQLNAAEITKSGVYQQRGKQPPELFKHLDLTIPRDVGANHAHSMVAELAEHIREQHGVAVVFATHAKDGQPNDCHFLISKRLVSDQGIVGKAARSLSTNPNSKGAIDSPVNEIRQKWADIVARETGVEWSIQTYKARGIEKPKEPKLSNKIRAIRKRETGIDPLDTIKQRRANAEKPSLLDKAKNLFSRANELYLKTFNKEKYKFNQDLKEYDKRETKKENDERKSDVKFKAEIKHHRSNRIRKAEKEKAERELKKDKSQTELAEYWLRVGPGEYERYIESEKKKAEKHRQEEEAKKLAELKEKQERERAAEIEANRAKHAEIERRKNEMPFVDKDGYTVQQSKGLNNDKEQTLNNIAENKPKLVSRGATMTDEQMKIIEKNNADMLKPRRIQPPRGRGGGRTR